MYHILALEFKWIMCRDCVCMISYQSVIHTRLSVFPNSATFSPSAVWLYIKNIAAIFHSVSCDRTKAISVKVPLCDFVYVLEYTLVQTTRSVWVLWFQVFFTPNLPSTCRAVRFCFYAFQNVLSTLNINAYLSRCDLLDPSLISFPLFPLPCVFQTLFS